MTERVSANVRGPESPEDVEVPAGDERSSVGENAPDQPADVERHDVEEAAIEELDLEDFVSEDPGWHPGDVRPQQPVRRRRKRPDRPR